jgi:light-regulated signal transduction histidine kinase (bacteriophytochrome)
MLYLPADLLYLLLLMGWTSSTGIAIIVRDQLWGLIIGHHQVPKAISYHMRMAGDFLAQALSMRITALLDKENHEQHRATLDLHVKLCDLMAAQVRVDALSHVTHVSSE